MTTYHVQINGTTDALQARRLESRLGRLPGVTGAFTVGGTGNLVVWGANGLLPLITRTVSETGYEVASPRTEKQRTPSMTHWYKRGWL